MSNEKWKCTNFDHCNDADKQTIIQIPRGRAFICPSCGGDSGIRTRTGWRVPGWLVFAIAGIVVVVLLLWALIPPRTPVHRPRGIQTQAYQSVSSRDH
jgi:hypothetical protein